MPGKSKSKSERSEKSKSKRSSSSSKRSSSSSKKKSSKSSKVEETTVPEPVVEETTNVQVQEVAPAETTTTDEEPKRRARRVVNRDSVLSGFDGIVEEIEREIETIRTADVKTKKTIGVKYLRSMVKRVKTLRNDAARTMKVRKASNRPKNNKSGFLAPAQISSDMAKFTGWDVSAPRSRVDVTKYICDYIKTKELQNEKDRRIIMPDDKLRKLLNITKDDTENLTYYSLQKKIQPHFPKKSM